MRPETLIAIYAAIVGTGALLLNFKSWLDSGVKLKIDLIPDGATIGGADDDRFDETDLVLITVTNRGDASTTITNLCLFEYPTRYRRWRRRPARTYVIANPHLKGYPYNVPSLLEPAKHWSGAIRKRQDLVPDLHTGTFYAAIYASHRDRPYLRLIPKLKDNLPPGTKEFDVDSHG